MAGWMLSPPTMPSRTPAVLWTPDPDEARESRIAGFARWVREHRDVGSDFPVDDLDYAGLHAWSVRDLDGFWSARRRAPRCDLPRPADRDAGPPRDARHRVVPGRDAQLRRARADPRPGPGRRRHRGGRGRGGRDRAGGHPRRAARPRRPGPRGPGRGRRRAGRPGRRAGTQLRRDPRRLPRDGVAGRGVVVVLTGLRAAGGARPLRPDRADRARRRRRLPLQRQAVRRAGDRRGAAGGAADAAGHGAGAAPRPRGDARRHGPVGDAHRHRRAAGVHARPVRPPAVGALLLGDDRAAQGHRAGARRDRRRAPQGARVPARPRPRRPVPVVHHHRLDDVELPDRRPAGRRDARALRRQPGPPRPGRAVGCGRAAPGEPVRHVGALPAGVPEGGADARGARTTCRRCRRSARPARRSRPSSSPGSPTAVGDARADLLGVRRHGRLHGVPRPAPRRCRCGWGSCPARRWARTSTRSTRRGWTSRSATIRSTWASW